MKIAYIGKKPFKKDNITGSRMIFPRFEAMEVEKEHAVRLLQFPDVFVEERDLEEAQKQIQAAELQRQEAIKAAEAELQAEIDNASREVTLDGKTVDLRKFTKAKLDTVVESQDLDVKPKGSTESVSDYCDRVFNALAEKAQA